MTEAFKNNFWLIYLKKKVNLIHKYNKNNNSKQSQMSLQNNKYHGVKTYIENFTVNYATSPVCVCIPCSPNKRTVSHAHTVWSCSAVTRRGCCYILRRTFSRCFLHLNTRQLEVHLYDPSSDPVMTTSVTAILYSRKLPLNTPK